MLIKLTANNMCILLYENYASIKGGKVSALPGDRGLSGEACCCYPSFSDIHSKVKIQLSGESKNPYIFCTAS